MKRFCRLFLLILCLCAATALSACAPSFEEVQPQDYLRIHVRADDNSAEAQTVKYKVKDAIVFYLSPLLSHASGKGEAMEILSAHLADVDEIASRVLRENGFLYGAKSALVKETFPTRVYDSATLPAGVYDALVVNLGSGAGDNWWCVAYPPLCFLPSGNAEDYTYRSAVWDWLKSLAN